MTTRDIVGEDIYIEYTNIKDMDKAACDITKHRHGYNNRKD